MERKTTAEQRARLKVAAEEILLSDRPVFIMPDEVLALLSDLETAEARILELEGKPAGDVPAEVGRVRVFKDGNEPGRYWIYGVDGLGSIGKYNTSPQLLCETAELHRKEFPFDCELSPNQFPAEVSAFLERHPQAGRGR